jgi:hypothetical protein
MESTLVKTVDKSAKLVRFYSQITIWSVVYGITAAHLPYLINLPWTTCDNCSSKLACVLLFHLYDGPLTFFNLYVGWYGLKRFSAVTRDRYLSLLNFAVSVNLAFFTFESVLIFTNLRNNSPVWENYALASVAIMLLGGCALGIYVKQKLTYAQNDPV